MLNHITMQHGYLFKVHPSPSPFGIKLLLEFLSFWHLVFICLQNGHRSRRFVIPESHAISLLSRDLRGTHLQALLGGGHSHRSSNTATTNISSDPLLSSFGLSFPTSDAPEPSKSTASVPDGTSVRKETPAQPWESRYIYTRDSVYQINFQVFLHLLSLHNVSISDSPTSVLWPKFCSYSWCMLLPN